MRRGRKRLVGWQRVACVYTCLCAGGVGEAGGWRVGVGASSYREVQTATPATRVEMRKNETVDRYRGPHQWILDTRKEAHKQTCKCVCVCVQALFCIHSPATTLKAHLHNVQELYTIISTDIQVQLLLHLIYCFKFHVCLFFLVLFFFVFTLVWNCTLSYRKVCRKLGN